MRDNNFVVKLSRIVREAVPCCDKEYIRGKFGMTDIVPHLVVLVTRFVVGDLP